MKFTMSNRHRLQGKIKILKPRESIKISKNLNGCVYLTSDSHRVMWTQCIERKNYYFDLLIQTGRERARLGVEQSLEYFRRLMHEIIIRIEGR